MKYLILVPLLVLFANCTNAQGSESIIVGKKETIYSKALGENRKIWIYNPAVTSRDADSGKRYPVLYLLDGDAHFLSTVGIVQQLSQANGNGVLPEMMVVGIENTNRLKDLTPALASANAPAAVNPFVKFLSSELIPYMDRNYSTAPYRLLVGHSLGGLTAIDILTHSPQLFNACIAIDPSMWYDRENHLNQAIARLPKQDLKGSRLFIGVANTLPPGVSLSKLKNDASAETQHIRSIFRLDKFLKGNTTGLLYAQQYYEKEKHNTVPLLSTYDGLRFIFDYYQFDATEKDFTDSTASLALRLKTHYKRISEKLGYQVAAPAAFISYMGYSALGQKQFKKAEAMFRLNMESYPEKSHVHAAYADYLAAMKDTINAIANYKKALQISNDAATLVKLNALARQQQYNLSAGELQRYAGVYVLDTYKIPIVLELRQGKLWSKVPGQADSEFVPVSENVFTVKDKQGYVITFKMDGERPTEFTSVQPNGTFRAVLKKD